MQNIGRTGVGEASAEFNIILLIVPLDNFENIRHIHKL